MNGLSGSHRLLKSAPLIAMLLVSNLSFGQVAEGSADEAEMRSLLSTFLAAVAERRGRDAAALVDRNALDVAEKAHELATNVEWDIFSQAAGAGIALVLRGCFDDDELKRSPRELIGLWIDKGLLLEDRWADRVTANRIVHHRTTRVPGLTLKVSGAALPDGAMMDVYFVKEAEQWRIRLDGLMALFWINLGIDHWVKPNDQTETDLLARHKHASSKKLNTLLMVMGPKAAGQVEPSTEEWAVAVYDTFCGRKFDDQDKLPRRLGRLN